MATFLLIHGAWQGAWCWREIVSRLEQLGHEADAMDLPGHGDDPASPATLSLQDYVRRIVEAVNILEHRPILVGHSMGGVIGYVADLVPPSGCSMMHYVSGFDPRYLAQFRWAPDQRTAQISHEGVKEFLYSCCPPEIVEAAYARFTPESWHRSRRRFQ